MSGPINRKHSLKDIAQALPEELDAPLKNPVEKDQKIAEMTSAIAKTAKETGTVNPKRVLDRQLENSLLYKLKCRFESSPKRSPQLRAIRWVDVEKALSAHREKIWSLQQMEATGGEPSVIGEENGEFIFVDSSAECPSGRKNCVFDKEAEEDLKKNFPEIKINGNASDMAEKYGVELMDEEQYRKFHNNFMNVDKYSRIWLKTPADVRKSGYAIVVNRTNDEVYLYEDWASSAREDKAFRAVLKVPKV